MGRINGFHELTMYLGRQGKDVPREFQSWPRGPNLSINESLPTFIHASGASTSNMEI